MLKIAEDWQPLLTRGSIQAQRRAKSYPRRLKESKLLVLSSGEWSREHRPPPGSGRLRPALPGPLPNFVHASQFQPETLREPPHVAADSSLNGLELNKQPQTCSRRSREEATAPALAAARRVSWRPTTRVRPAPSPPPRGAYKSPAAPAYSRRSAARRSSAARGRPTVPRSREKFVACREVGGARVLLGPGGAEDGVVRGEAAAPAAGPRLAALESAPVCRLRRAPQHPHR